MGVSDFYMGVGIFYGFWSWGDKKEGEKENKGIIIFI